MKLFRALSVSALCFLTRHTCAAVPVFENALPSMTEDDDQNRNNNFSENRSREWREKCERRMADYILQEVNNCRSLLPSENGFLVHIDYSKTYMKPRQENTNQQQPNSEIQKRVLHKLVKTWKSMPTDQRLQAVGSLAGVLALPAFLTGAAQAWDAEQIQKIKQKAAEAEVAKHKGGKRKAVKESTSAMPPPPPSAFNHVKRDGIMVLLDEVQDDRGGRKEQRGLGGTITKSMGHVHLPTFRPSAGHAASKTASHAGSHMSTSMSRTVSSAPKQVSTMKEPNPTVARVLSWTGAMTSLMYIPAAYQAIHKAQYVTDDDAHAYRRRGMDDGDEDAGQLPIVTCIPVARKGLNYVIPEGALRSQNVLSSSLSSAMPIYEDTILGRRAESAALNKAGKHAKLVGIAGMGVGLGWLMHQLNQRRGQTEINQSERMLIRRDESEMDDSADLERRWKPGKGSVFTAAMFAGTALSASGLGVPQLHATVTEDPKAGTAKQRLQKRGDQVVLQRRQTLKHQLGRLATDKVTMFLATTATAYGAVKTGAASALYNAIVSPHQKPNPPKQHVRRDEDSIDSSTDDDQAILLESETCTENDCQLERRSGRKTTIFAAALLGTFLGQRTGKSGQEKENKQYLEQIGQGPPKQRRDVDSNDIPDFVLQDSTLAKRSPGKNSEVAEAASSSVRPYVLPGAVAVTTMAASFAGRKAVKSTSNKELDRRDMASVLVKRGGQNELGRAASKLARQVSKGKGPAIQHTVAETVSVTHVNLGKHAHAPHVEAPHLSHGGGHHNARQQSSGHSRSGSSSSSSGSVQSKPHLQRQASTASSSSSSPSSRHQGNHSPKHEPNEQVKQFYRDHPDVAMPARVEEVHRIHHAPSPEHNGAPAQEVATKKSSKGKKIAFAGVGAALGAFGHHQYTNAVDAKAQAAQQQAAQEPAPDAAAPPAKRSLQKRSPQGRRRRRGRGGGGGGHGHGGSMTTFKMVHQHTFDHYLEPVGQQMKKGGGKKGAIGALVLGAVAGVVGHAIYHNSKANQAANQAPSVDAAEATAPQPPEPPKQENAPPAGGSAPPAPGPKKRSFDDCNDGVEKREAKGGKLPSALTGGLVGMAVAGYGYAFTHDQPGTRKKHTVPVGTLPQNTEGATKAKKRSVDDVAWQEENLVSPDVEVESRSDENDVYNTEDVKSEKRNMLAKYFNKLTPKQKVGGAIAGGIILSTAAAMVDPGAKEASRPITKRELGDEQLLEERGKYGKKDIAIVSAIAGVAGLTGLMKRDEPMIEAIEDHEPVYQDIVARGPPTSFQNRAFAIADYATIALMGGTLIKNAAGALSSSKSHPKREFADASEEATLLTRRDSGSFNGKSGLLHPIDAEYQSFLSKRSTDEEAFEEDVEDVFDDMSGDTISRRTVKMMKLSGPFTHTLARKASHAAPAAKAAAHPTMDSLVGKMSMATIAGAITAPILKSVLGGSGSPSKGPTSAPPPVKRNLDAEISMDKRAEYSRYIEAVKKEVAEKLKKRDISEPLDDWQEFDMVKRKAAEAEYGKYIEAVKKEVGVKLRKRDISSFLDGHQEVQMIKRKAADADYGKYIEAVKKQVAGKLKKRDISDPSDGWLKVKMTERKAAGADYGRYIEAVKESTEKKL